MLDLKPIKETNAKLRDRGEHDEAKAGGIGDRERASLYYLNLASFAGERHVTPLVAEVEQLRYALAKCLVAMHEDALDSDGYSGREIEACALAAPLVGIEWSWHFNAYDDPIYTMRPSPTEVAEGLQP